MSQPFATCRYLLLFSILLKKENSGIEQVKRFHKLLMDKLENTDYGVVVASLEFHGSVKFQKKLLRLT